MEGNEGNLLSRLIFGQFFFTEQQKVEETSLLPNASPIQTKEQLHLWRTFLWIKNKH